MLSDKSTVCPLNLLDIAHQKRGIKAAIVNAGKELPMLSVMDAVKEKLIVPVLIGDKEEIKKIAEELKFDKIIFATGYDALSGPILSLNLTGRKNIKLNKYWKNGPITYLGLMIPNFPNFFIISIIS